MDPNNSVTKRLWCIYGKYPKISNTLFHTFWAKIFLFMQMFLKIFNGMANSVDQEQSDLGLYCLPVQFCRTLWCMQC